MEIRLVEILSQVVADVYLIKFTFLTKCSVVWLFVQVIIWVSVTSLDQRERYSSTSSDILLQGVMLT